MNRIRLLSSAEQVAAHLRAALAQGIWTGEMPGVLWLESALGINRNTVEAALGILEDEGVLTRRGAGRKRGIVALPPGRQAARQLRVVVLPYESGDRSLGYLVDLVHELSKAGHSAMFAAKALLDLGMDVKRIASMVAKTEADAWVVVAGSHEVLEWFSTQPVPAFALFGRRNGLPIAATGLDKVPPFAAVARTLCQLGHHRIVHVVGTMQRRPVPGPPAQAFLDELELHDLTLGNYNLPDWEDTKEGLQTLLTSLFRVTPPTALMIDMPFQFAAVQQFLAKRCIQVPQDVSLVCTDDDPTFAWCEPSIARIRWDSRPLVRRILRWAANVSCGRPDLRQTLTPAEFIAGGTIGPVPGRRCS